jgi:drug/metabolite transporter (DMT)-like permease
VFWSFGSSLVYLGAREAGTWRFVAIASLSGGLLQFLFRRVYSREIKTAVLLPWRLWAGPVLCFVIYGMAWPCALASASADQVGGVNLINYLWPVLTVVFSAWWVPGVRLTPKLGVAMGLALLGLACANAGQWRGLFANPGAGAGQARVVLPYALALVAAITWAFYSALLARWRAWAEGYVTSPAGFIVIGSVAWLVLEAQGHGPADISRRGFILIFLYSVGPLAAGYLLWELALARARVQSLSLVAALTPILSTITLCFFLRQMPGPDLGLAALLVSSGVVLSLRS